MAYYDLDKTERSLLSAAIRQQLYDDLAKGEVDAILKYGADTDTYIRKAAYLGIGRIFLDHPALRASIVRALKRLLAHSDPKVRQTVINAAGEIGKTDLEMVQDIFDSALFDVHHAPRNAVIGSIKKMGAVDPGPVLSWAQRYLQHPDKEIRREICHGIELRGRSHPQDILPLLQRLEFDPAARVRNTLIHVLGQIAYKKGCLETVLAHLHGWKNKALVQLALNEIIDVHHRYRNFAHLTQEQAIDHIRSQEWDFNN